MVGQHQADVITGLTAEELFTGLQRRLEALDSLAASPVSLQMSVAQLKRALPNPIRHIEVFVLVDGETTHVGERANTPERYPLSGDVNAFANSIRGYRDDSDTLLHLLATGAFHDHGEHDQLWLRVLGRLAGLRTKPGDHSAPLWALRHYPALLATWAMGLTAVLAHLEELIARLLLTPIWRNPFERSRGDQMPARFLNLCASSMETG